MMAGFSKYSAAWKTVLEPITSIVAIYEADVVLSKAEKHVPCGESVDTTTCITLQTRYRIKRGRFKEVKLCNYS
jgi:hypothetical protein